ncbi:MAG: hypothetical protein A2Y07_11200 [Planctomycetes bacterium GWF2_50_10]|nr:MAG: hypothetical protein A2Y07_11200 [Planctomycetes bacterium GWF2_50_10]
MCIFVVSVVDEISIQNATRIVKAYGSRALNMTYKMTGDKRWWTKSASMRFINTQASLEKAIEYVKNQ